MFTIVSINTPLEIFLKRIHLNKYLEVKKIVKIHMTFS